MTFPGFPEPNSEGHWCHRCSVHRTRTVAGLCPSCLDDDKRAEMATQKEAS